jgi:protein O-mannosyl-transferase
VWAGRVVGFGGSGPIALNCVKISRTTLVGVALVIFAGTIWLYWPSVQGGFLTRMDDDEYLRQSVRLNGLTYNAVKWAFTTTQPYYHPLPRLSHVLDYQIWGKNAAGHHATSVMVHALNAALLFGFLWTLMGVVSLATGERLAMALGVAAVFAIHPFQVESVAWMSGRTQLLCTTFGIGCLWAYVAGARRWVVWGLFVAALLCKPMAVSLPFVMLAMDYFPLRRHETIGWGQLLREKAGAMALAGVAAAATIITEVRVGGLIVSVETLPLWQRVWLMFHSLAFYPWRLVCPVHLSPFYPLPSGHTVDRGPVVLSVLGVGIVTGLAMWERRRTPAAAAGWAAYVILVLPVSGLTQTGLSAASQRYAYLAMVPLLLLAGGAVVWLWRRSATVVHLGLAGLLACEMCVFSARTRSLIPVWHDDETLWRTVLAEYPDSLVANNAMVLILFAHHKTTEALAYAQRYVELMPQLGDAHNNLGFILAAMDRVPEAMEEYKQALRLKPNYAEAHNNFANTLMQVGKVEDALRQYEQALQIKPRYVDAELGMGWALLRLGRRTEAIRHYEQALEFDPDSVIASNMLARLQYSQ